MTQKPKIQYVGQFYVYGSEAPALDHRQKRAKTQLPQARQERAVKIAVDPVALVSIAVAVFLLVTMAVGALQIHNDWQQYHQMKNRLYTLQQEHSKLYRQYQESFDLESVRSKAVGIGLVPKDSVKTIEFQLTPPEPEKEMTWLDELKWFWEGLLE